MDKKYVKVMFGNVSGANKDVVYKLDEINIAKKWNVSAKTPDEMGGFNFSTEDKIIRWLVRGDTLYDVNIPDGAEVIECENKSTPHGVFITNKIIISNPRTITDELTMKLYLESDLPEKSYYKTLAGLAIRGHVKTCKKLISDRINKGNIDVVLSEIYDFIGKKVTLPTKNQVFDEVMQILYNIKKKKSVKLW